MCPDTKLSLTPCKLQEYRAKLGGDFKNLKQDSIRFVNMNWENINGLNSGSLYLKIDLNKATKKLLKTIRNQMRNNSLKKFPVTVKEIFDNKIVAKYKGESFISSITIPEYEEEGIELKLTLDYLKAYENINQ